MVKSVLTVALAQVCWSAHWPADVASNAEVSPPMFVGDNTRITEDQIRALGFDQKLQDFCRQEMGCSDLYSHCPWSIQGESDWHDKPNPNTNPPYTHNEDAIFSNVNHRAVGAETNVMEKCNNLPGEEPLLCHVTDTWHQTQSSSTTITKGKTHGVSLSLEMRLPFTEESDTANVQFSSSTADSHTQTKGVDLGTDASVSMPGGESSCLHLQGTITTMTADWKMKVDMEGNILCRFNSKCQGHYLWYVALKGFSTTIEGTTSSDTSESAGIMQCKGVVPDICPGNCDPSSTAQNSSFYLSVV